MALKGTLEDMPVIDLIQFAHQSRRTGALVISDGMDEARLYYLKGKLVRAESGHRQGHETLVQVVDWSKGEFEFLPGVEATEANIEMDLHRSVMNALKVRDERREQTRTAQPSLPAPAESLPAEEDSAGEPADRGDLLGPFVAGAISYAALVSESGAIQAEAHAADAATDRIEELRDILTGLCRRYPGALRRVFVEDDRGMVAAAPVPGQGWLVLGAGKASSLGAMSVAITKILAVLAARGQAAPERTD